jgi:hypothetical protein
MAFAFLSLADILTMLISECSDIASASLEKPSLTLLFFLLF